MSGNAKAKEPLFHISKRDGLPIYKAILIRVIAIFFALCTCAVVIYALTEMNPLEVYKSMFEGAVGTNRRLWTTIRDSATLLLIAIAITPAFRMRFWNIGAEGQVLVGGLATAAVMIYGGGHMPQWLLMTCMVVASLAAGMIWGLIPAHFKAKYNTNETLFTLMLNYVAMQMVTFAIVFWENPKGSNTVGVIHQIGKFGWFPELFGQKYGWNVAIVLGVTLAIYLYMRFSKQGYEVAVVGESENTARYAGINVGKVILRTMAISGALCGLAGFVIVSGSSHTISTSTAGGRGFTAIIVSWLSKFNPFMMILVSFFLVFMEKGAMEIATQFKLNENASDVITGIILFFILGCEFFCNYRVSMRRAPRKEIKA